MSCSHRLLALALLAACAPATEPAATSGASTTIALARGAVWITSPDDDRVVLLDPDSLAEIDAHDAIPGASHLASDGETVVVTEGLGTGLHAFPGGRFELPCGGPRGVGLEGRVAHVTCPHDRRVVSVDLDTGGISVTEVSGRPLTVVGATLPPAVDPGDRSVTQFSALAIGPRGLVGAYQIVDNDGDRDRPPQEGGYGSVIDDAPRIEPQILWDCDPSYARFDGGRRVFSGPAAVAWSAEDDVLWVVHRSTQNVAALRCGQVLGHWRVGAGARGVVVIPGGALVDVGFDHAVARLDLADARGDEPVSPATVVRRTVVRTRLSDLAQLGRRLFHDATNPHLTPSGVVTCSTCHPDGGDDGLTWFVHTPGVTRRLRRTAPAWNARMDAQPLHWDGEFADAASLARSTIRELMEGDALLVDTAAIAAWLDQAPRPPAPRGDMALVLRGQQVFTASGCDGCHHGPQLTDGLLHAVVPDSDDADANIDAVVTRPLLAVRARAPYLHDGRAQTLYDVHALHNREDRHGRTSTLTEDDRRALVAYLESL